MVLIDTSEMFVMKIQVSSGFIITQGEDVNILGRILIIFLSVQRKKLFLILFFGEEWKKNAFSQTNGHISCTWVKLTYFSNSTTRDTTSATEPIIPLHFC